MVWSNTVRNIFLEKLQLLNAYNFKTTNLDTKIFKPLFLAKKIIFFEKKKLDIYLCEKHGFILEQYFLRICIVYNLTIAFSNTYLVKHKKFVFFFTLDVHDFFGRFRFVVRKVHFNPCTFHFLQICGLIIDASYFQYYFPLN